MTPRVSVVMPAFNAAPTIGAAVSSVLWQSYTDRELIVVDDGSTDGTAAIVASYGARVRLFTQSHMGVAAARNRAVDEAKGELVAFCDADDLFFELYLDAMVKAYDRHGGIVTANAWLLFPGGIRRDKTRHTGRFPRPGEQRRAILEQNFVSTMSLCARGLFREVGPFDVALEAAEDWDFWMRAVLSGQRVSHQSEPLALFRWGARGLSVRRDEMDAAVVAVLQKAARRVGLTSDERTYVERRLAGPDPRCLGRQGDDALRARRYREAARLYRSAAAMVPSERRLVWKARVMASVPRLVGPLVRRRQRGIERALGFDEHRIH